MLRNDQRSAGSPPRGMAKLQMACRGSKSIPARSKVSRLADE
jgi:hypothetical protein